MINRGGSRIFFRRGCTRLLLSFNTNKPHSFFFAEYQLYQKTASHLGGGGVRTSCTLPLDPPLINTLCPTLQLSNLLLLLSFSTRKLTSMASYAILSNFFSGLHRALFRTTFLDIAINNKVWVKVQQNKSSVTPSEKTKSYSVSEN